MGSVVSAVPQLLQNLDSWRFSFPQFLQTGIVCSFYYFPLVYRPEQFSALKIFKLFRIKSDMKKNEVTEQKF
jgi:hypothetical protein